MEFLFWILGYIVSVVIAWFLMRWDYIILGEDSQYNPHYLSVVFVLIPIFNVPLTIGLVLNDVISKTAYKLPKLNYKNIFRLK